MTRINLNVKTLDGQSHSMESVDDTQTISQFKVEVGRMLGLEPGTLRMIFSGRVLQDEKPLSEFELSNKTVHVVQRAPPQTQRPNPPEPTPSVAQPPPERRFPFPTIEVLMPLRALENPLRALDLSRATGRLYHAGSMLNRAKRTITELENQSRGAAPERSLREGPSGANGQPRDTDGPTAQNGDPSLFPRNVRRYAALMREYRETYSRLVPFLEQVENALETPNRAIAQQNQALFDEVTEAMHLLSHVFHALSDSSIDFREDGPLYVRSRAGGAEAPDSLQSAGVSVRVRAPRSALAVTPGTSRTVNLMISGDWQQPRVSTNATQGATSTPNVAYSASTLTGSVPAPPTTSASGAATTAAITASTGNPMMSFLDLVMGVTPQASGASVGDGASMSFSTAVDLQRELQSAVQVALGGATVRTASTSSETNNEPTVRVLGSTITPNIPTAQVATQGRPNFQPDEFPSYFEELSSLIQTLAPSTSSNASVPTPAPTTSSSAQSSGSATTSSTSNIGTASTSSTPNIGSATSANPSSASTATTATPILITAEAETMARPGFTDPRLHRFFHRAHQSQRNFERDPFLVCGSWRVPAGTASEGRAEGQAQTTERLSPTAATARATAPPTTATNTQTPRADTSRTTAEPQRARTLGDQLNTFDQSLLPMLMQAFQDMRNPSTGFSAQSGLDPETQTGANGPQSHNRVLAEVLGFGSDQRSGQTILSEAITAALLQIRISEFMDLMTGNFTFFSRIQEPVAEVLRRRLLLDDTISIEEGVQRAIDELHPYLERVSREANPIANVDISESLNKFLHTRLLGICLCLIRSPNDEFSENIMTLVGNAVENFVLLLIKATNDGPLSCERVVRAIIEQMVDDGEFPPPAVYIVIAHLRNYMARVQRERADEPVDHWVVKSDSAEYSNRQRARRQRLEARGSNSSAEEVDTFVTPRSSPDPMDTESGMIPIHEQVAEESRSTERSSGDSLIPPSMRSSDLPFPRELLMSNTTRTEVSGRQGGPWHAHLPRDWVAIVDRDAERQANQAPQPPFSDGYLSMQPAKRRRVVSANKPSGDLSSVIAETIRDAISASGVSPVSSVNTVVNEAAGSASLARAMETETRKIASENMSNSASECEKFPNFSEFAKK